MLKTILSIVSIQLMVGQALACIGNGESYNISFRETQNPGELIVNLREVKSDSFQELIDDTGYVSVHLAITRLAKDARATQIKELSEPNETLGFLRSRITAMDEYFIKHLDSATRKQFSQASEKLKNAVNQKPVRTDELVGGISEINGFLYQSGIEIQASQRKSANDTFSAEIPLQDIKLPTYIVTRSVGCNAGIDGFNTTVSKSPQRSGSGVKGRGNPSAK